MCEKNSQNIRVIMYYLHVKEKENSICVDRVICNDGFSMSVQASQYHYCTPQTQYTITTEYTHMEVGYPSEIEESLLPFAENENDPCDTVYARVPVEIINEVIMKHGGVKLNN
jgi:hypothetical protein